MFSQQLTSLKYCAVTAISVLPNFGALGDFEDGYVFYPDGSGAISCASAEHPSYQHYFLEDVYSADTPALDELLQKGESGKQQVLMPVFGAKHGDTAYLAVVDSGAEYAAIEYYPSGLSLNVHRVDAYFRCRRTAAVYDEGSSRGAIYELERFDTAYTVNYYFLRGDAANYSGMACRYREYLLAGGMLRQSPLVAESGLVAVNFIMGVTKSELISREFEAVTTFAQAEGIAAANQAGAYAWAYLDWASDSPDEATGYVFTDESVPFYQMVLHGYVMYSAKAFNKFYDTDYETLRALEYGYMPVFDVTWAETARLKDSSCYDQFSTCFADWEDAIVQASQSAAALSAVADSPMLRHERRADGTVCVTYGNGCRLVLNYNEEPVTVDGVSIAGMDWHLFEEQE